MPFQSEYYIFLFFFDFLYSRIVDIIQHNAPIDHIIAFEVLPSEKYKIALTVNADAANRLTIILVFKFLIVTHLY